MNSLVMLLSSYGNTYSSADTAGAVLGSIMAILLSMTPLFIAIVISVFTGLIFLASYLLVAILEHKILKKAEYDKCWIAFIPFIQLYAIMELPHREEFNLGVFKLPRKTAALISVIASPAIGALALVFWLLNFIPFLGFILWAAFCLFASLAGIVLKVFNWRTYYDFYSLYMDDEKRMIFSILGIFIPIIPLIFFFIFVNKEPKYKWTDNAPVVSEAVPVNAEAEETATEAAANEAVSVTNEEVPTANEAATDTTEDAGV